jgi:hypothetical protein
MVKFVIVIKEREYILGEHPDGVCTRSFAL